jgi:hypothetical protein
MYNKIVILLLIMYYTLSSIDIILIINDWTFAFFLFTINTFIVLPALADRYIKYKLNRFDYDNRNIRIF